METGELKMTPLVDLCISEPDNAAAGLTGTPAPEVDQCAPLALIDPGGESVLTVQGEQVADAVVHDRDERWELCYLNVPRLSEFCTPHTAACLAALDADACNDVYEPYYSECLIYTGVCADDPAWQDSYADDVITHSCQWYAENDPGCTILDDLGQRENCPVTCNTCTDPCDQTARDDECSVERMRHWYRGDDWSCDALEADGEYDCSEARQCGYCDNAVLAAKNFDTLAAIAPGEHPSSTVCELAENAVDKVCCADAGLDCADYPPASCSDECKKVMKVIDKCTHREISDSDDDSLMKVFWDSCSVPTDPVTDIPEPPTVEDMCYAAVQGYVNECDGKTCCLARSTAGLDALHQACSALGFGGDVLYGALWGTAGAEITAYVGGPAAWSADNCATYELSCPAQEVTDLYSGKGFLYAGDCCSSSSDCVEGLLCDTARRVCTQPCELTPAEDVLPDLRRPSLDGSSVTNDVCGAKPSTRGLADQSGGAGYNIEYSFCAAVEGETSGVCDMESRCPGDRRYVCREACSSFVGPSCYIQCPDGAAAADCGAGGILQRDGTWPTTPKSWQDLWPCDANGRFDGGPEKEDCFHHCAPSAWDGDKVCDAGKDQWYANATQPSISRPFLACFPPFFRCSFALSGFLAPRRRERAKNGGKWAKFGGETGEKQWWLSGVGHRNRMRAGRSTGGTALVGGRARPTPTSRTRAGGVAEPGQMPVRGCGLRHWAVTSGWSQPRRTWQPRRQYLPHCWRRHEQAMAHRRC